MNYLKPIILTGLLFTTPTPEFGPSKNMEKTSLYAKSELYKEIAEEQKIETIQIAELDNTPFRLEKKGRKQEPKKTFGAILGYSQAETIMKQFNAVADSVQFDPKQKYSIEDVVNFPLIYPELKQYFPQNIDSLNKNETLEKYLKEKTDHMIIVSQCDNKKVALAYYCKGKLILATYVSPGTTWNKTPEGKYIIKHDKIFRRSTLHKQAPMPYSLNINGHIFLHQGESDGSLKSHGCIRIPGLYVKRLHENLPKKTILLEKKLNENKQLYDKLSEKDNTQNIEQTTIILAGIYKPTLPKLESTYQ